MTRSLFGRLLAVMCGVAAASTGLALLLQERSLSRDLERAAERRLAAAANAAERLLEGHLGAMAERYRAVSGTPQFRASLEIDDGPTLAHYASALQGQQGAVRIAFLDPAGRPPGVDAAALGVEGSGVVAHAGRPLAVVSTPLGSVGRLVAVEPIEAATLEIWSELCGARVSFARAGEGGHGELRRSVRALGELELRVASSLSAEREAMAHARLSLAAAAGLGLAVAFAVSLFLSRGLVRPILGLQTAARRIGAGDLTASVRIDRGDEIGDVARAFQDMVGELSETLGQVARAADRVEATAAKIAGGTRDFVGVIERQRSDSEEAAATLDEIQGQVRSIAESAADSGRGLDLAVDGSTASFKELARLGQRLKEIVAKLWTRTDEIGGSLARMARSAEHVAADADALLPAVEETAQAVGQMAGSARSVNAHTEETSRLSGSVVDAAERGRRVVREAVEGMESTRRTVDDAERVIRSLGQRVHKIGSILTVIDDVTDETGLLALNAAIIAAQAGESGRAFAVVAEEMKALSLRVQQSTKEIEGLVHGVQDESANAVVSIEAGSSRAREGEILIQQAEASLAEIARAARESGQRMAESARATADQMGAAAHVAEQMAAVRDAVGRIRHATREQAEGHEVIARSSDELRQVARAVQQTVDEQTLGAARIGEGIESVQRAVGQITKGLEEQMAASHQVADVMRRSQQQKRSHEESSARMHEAGRELEREAEALRSAVRRFRIRSDAGSPEPEPARQGSGSSTRSSPA